MNKRLSYMDALRGGRYAHGRVSSFDCNGDA